MRAQLFAISAANAPPEPLLYAETLSGSKCEPNDSTNFGGNEILNYSFGFALNNMRYLFNIGLDLVGLRPLRAVALAFSLLEHSSSRFRLQTLHRSLCYTPKPSRVRIPPGLQKKDTKEGALFLYGPGGIRTHDLCVANAALSQLSYKPETVNGLQMRNLPLSQAVVKA